MKKALLLACFASLLTGCSYADLLRGLPSPPPPPASATATAYLTPSSTPTVTPTQPTATFTSTPTLIYLEGRLAPSFTPNALPTLWMLPTATATIGAQPLIGNGPFTTILVSGQQLRWGSCEPASVRATIKVADQVPAHTVLIFLRLEDPKTGETTQWGGGAIMERQGNGVFTYTLTAKSFTHYREYMRAWGQYQFVALDARLQRIGASTQYLKNLTIEPCP